ncbi:MAG: phosphomannomutase [Selenomonadaceae bacterium]|nr:phosphomannomutase [Selenomonadaceae bacterium]
MNITTEAFGAFDIRGIYPESINEKIAYRIGRALPKLFDMKNVVVGYDIRLSSKSLTDALIKGLAESGADVSSAGLIGTEMIYFATSFYGFDGGVMVTASHNPKEYNGMKFVRKNSRPISENNGLKELAAEVLKEPPAVVDNIGKVKHLDMMTDYVNHILSYVNIDKLKPYKVVANIGNGAAGAVVKALKEKLPFDMTMIFEEPDGAFPNGVPNPLKKENRAATIEAVKKYGADVGVAWDGDFDRCFLFDENGGFIEGYYMVGFLAEAFLKKEKGATIIYDPRLTWNTIETVKKYGGNPVMVRSGHAFIKDKMRELDAVYGGELSSHHYFRDFYYCDSGMIPWLLTLELMSEMNKPLSKLMKDRQEAYPASGEISRRVADPDKTLEKVKERYAPKGKFNDIDGVSVDFEDWRFNLRKSGTEPDIRLNVESRGNRELMEEKTRELLDMMV